MPLGDELARRMATDIDLEPPSPWRSPSRGVGVLATAALRPSPVRATTMNSRADADAVPPAAGVTGADPALRMVQDRIVFGYYRALQEDGHKKIPHKPFVEHPQARYFSYRARSLSPPSRPLLVDTALAAMAAGGGQRRGSVRRGSMTDVPSSSSSGGALGAFPVRGPGAEPYPFATAADRETGRLPVLTRGRQPAPGPVPSGTGAPSPISASTPVFAPYFLCLEPLCDDCLIPSPPTLPSLRLLSHSLRQGRCFPTRFTRRSWT